MNYVLLKPNKSIIFSRLIISMLLLMYLISGCSNEAELDLKSISPEEREIILKAQETGRIYFEEKYNADIEYTKYKFTPTSLASTVGLNGHVKGNPEQEIFLLINYETYVIDTASVPQELEEIVNTNN